MSSGNGLARINFLARSSWRAFIPFNSFLNKAWFLCVCSTSIYEDTMGKGEIARYEHFLLFPQCFLLVWRNFLPFSSNSKLSSANSFNLEASKFVGLERVNDCAIFFMQTNTSKLPVLRLKDLSKFGTWVNKQKVEGERLLKDGDVIHFGSPSSSFK